MKKNNGLPQDYYSQRNNEYKKTINAYATNDFDVNRLSDARSCKAVPGDTADRSGAVCYTPADIQRKISESLAIAAECDEIAIRYRALVRAYESVRADR